jgi:hypothetical protein
MGPEQAHCALCGGRLIPEEEYKLREEAQDLVEKDGPDDDMTPLEDVVEAVKDEILSFGNDHVWQCIEELAVPEARAHERGLFLRAGGKCPAGEPVTI